VDAQAALAVRYEADPNAVKKELTRKELRELRKYIKDRKKKSGDDKEEEPEAESEPAEPAPIVEAPVVAAPDKLAAEQSKKPAAKKTAPAKTQTAKTASGAFLFRAVKGIDVKCKQLTVINSSLFAATGSGVFPRRE
jgi:hypothetical protein